MILINVSMEYIDKVMENSSEMESVTKVSLGDLLD